MPVKRKLSAKKRNDLRAYSTIATQYCRDVVAGKIRACRWVRLACQRHLDDLVRARSADFDYKFDAIRAGKACAFIERLPHVKGHWALGHEPIRLEPWQCFIVCSIFGWVSKKAGLRRFRQAIIIVPRKNAKTTLAAGIGLKLFLADDEPGAEIYCGASKEKQAFEVFSPAKRMVQRAPGLKEYFDVEIAKKSMYLVDDDMTKFEPVIGAPGDGPSPHAFIHDEFHEQDDWTQYNAAKTGMGARRQPLQLIITTAGVNIDGPCYSLQEDLKRILQGDIPNERIFGVIYTIDDPEKWDTLEAAQEANPNYGVSVLEDYIKGELEEARQRASHQGAYKCKNLDIWTGARDPWMNMLKWKACADPSLCLDEFWEYPCYQGFDLGARLDLTSRCRIFIAWRGDGRHYFAFWQHYLPQARAFDGDHQHYERWINEGRAPITIHDSVDIQLAFVQKEVEDELSKFKGGVILGFDPHQALQMEQELQLRLGEEKVLDVQQNWRYLDPAMKEVEAAVYSGRFHHTGDPIANWAIGNVQVKPDANENIFPRKEDRPNIKIDPASALFNGMYLALACQPPRRPFTPAKIGFL